MHSDSTLSPTDVALAQLAAIVTSSNDAIVSKTLTGVVCSWNAAAERMFGYSAEEMVGQSIRRLIPDDRQQEEDEILAKISAGEEVKNFSTLRMRKDGTLFPVSVTVSPIHDESGRVIGASKIVRDFTEHTAMLQSVRESEARFRMLADNISQLAWMADKDGYVFWYNQRWYDYTGTTLEQMQGWGWRAVHHPDHVQRVVKRIQHSWDTGEPWEDTFPLRGADGQYRWFLSRALPIRDENGAIERWFGSNTDITDQIEQVERINLLMAEVNHRSKNMLALVMAIARQAAKEDEQAFVERFAARVQALAAGQDVLIHSGWRGADIESLVRSQLAHFSDLIGSRILMRGPRAMLNATAAQTLGMALHELATNAGKYGALSNERGRVDIGWKLLPEADGARRLAFEWIESGGPPVEAPSRKGFGTSVIDRMARASLGAEVAFDFRPEGLVWRLTCQVGRALQEEGGVAPTSATLAAIPAAQTSAPRVLLVEDEPIVALDLTEVLEAAGYKVIGPAATPAEAMRLLAEHRCDVAVLDIKLGHESSEAVAKHLIDTATPFLTLSAYADEQKPPIFRGVPHVPKPLEVGRLFATLSALRAGALPN